MLIHLNHCGILSDCQYGFRQGRSTQKTIFKLINSLYSDLNVDNITGLIFLDISKAFDSLDHSILLEKLHDVRLANNSLKWFQSYLDRQQVVQYNDMVSEAYKFNYGIPQGSCLGPTLFIFYINDLFKYIENVNMLMFADDCVLYKSGNSWGPVRQSLQDALNIYIAWGNDHNLTLNVSKTKAMVVCTEQKRVEIGDPAPFSAGNRPIFFVSHFCYLGAIIDNEMSMSQEYKSVYRKVEHKIFMLGKLRYFLDRKSALLVYKQAILPLIDYASFLLLSVSLGCKRDLQGLQNNALRICLRYRMQDHVTRDQLHDDANLQSLEQRRIVQTLSLLHDCSNNHDYVKTTRNRTRADAKIVYNIPTKCTTRFLNSPYYKGIQYWNMLENHVQRAATPFIFKKYMRSLYNNYVNLLGN